MWPVRINTGHTCHIYLLTRPRSITAVAGVTVGQLQAEHRNKTQSVGLTTPHNRYAFTQHVWLRQIRNHLHLLTIASTGCLSVRMKLDAKHPVASVAIDCTKYFGLGFLHLQFSFGTFRTTIGCLAQGICDKTLKTNTEALALYSGCKPVPEVRPRCPLHFRARRGDCTTGILATTCCDMRPLPPTLMGRQAYR
jgi:hypothetical protein